MSWLCKRLKRLLARGKKARTEKAKGKKPASGDPIEAQPEPISPPLNSVGPIVLVDNIGRGAAGVDASGTDIVLVHGLRGSSLGTWSKGDICWPRDFLKKDVEDIRVITWGYDANIANIFDSASQESIYGHAGTLLNDLARVRVGITRPVVFVCHSLGGLVVKQALIVANSYKHNGRHPNQAAIFIHTAGVIFMGTPHRGSSKEPYGDVIANIAKLALQQPNKQLLQTLRQDSHILEGQRNDFTTISRDMEIVCVREEKATGIGMIVPEMSASYEGFKVLAGSINANHMNMVKFASQTDPGYQRTLGWIVALCNTAQVAQQEAMKPHKERINEILRILHFPSVDQRESSIEPAYADTCTWIMEGNPFTRTNDHGAPQFKAWLENDESVFWISGKAGCGKSTLMKYVYHHIDTKAAISKLANDKKLVMARYFFQENGDSMQKSREGMIRSILYQILKERRDLVPVAFPTFMGDMLPTSETINIWTTLSNALFSMLNHLQDSKVCLFIDGLDEYRMIDKMHCYTEEQLDLTYDGNNEDETWGLSDWIVEGHEQIADFVIRLKNLSNVKVGLSSRELNIFELKFSEFPRIQVHQHTAGAIKRYCEGRLAEDAHDLADREEFVSSITDKSRGVFLWVQIVITMLVDGCRNGDNPLELRKALDKLPQRLGGKDGLYMSMMQNVKRKDLFVGARLFQLVMHIQASQPYFRTYSLDIVTLFLAEEGHLDTDGDGGLRARKDKFAPRTWEELRERRTNLQRRLKSRCGGLLEGTEDVQFIHQTAKQFMSRAYLWNLIFPDSCGLIPEMDKDLALLSGLVRRMKCCQEAVFELQETQSTEQSPGRSWLRPETPNPSDTAIRLVDIALGAVNRLNDSFGNVDNFKELLDELDAAAGDLLDGRNIGLTAPSHRSWVETMFVESESGGRPTNILELMTWRNVESYVVSKLKGNGITQPQLQKLLRAASQHRPLVWRGQNYGFNSEPSPRTVAALLAAGVDPNSEPDKSDESNAAVGPQKVTAWTDFLLDTFPNRRSRGSISSEQLAIIDLFLKYGADPTARVYDKKSGEFVTAEILLNHPSLVELRTRFPQKACQMEA